MRPVEYVAKQIRECRDAYAGGKGMSQEALAGKLGVAANTISRWETGTYQPDLDDLEKLATSLGVSILEFFPREGYTPDDRVAALLRTAKELDDTDLEELRRYAEFRRARYYLAEETKTKPGRKRKKV
ncbi:MAG: helix-turn-helix transcriptional regulator [Chloroflexi bacterium]|nr:helix-turn-helix transcriptional regulator [Chloroflexota bacterium]